MDEADLDCKDLHNFPAAHNISVCSFVKNASSCDIDQGFINYTQLLYCTLEDIPIAVACILLVIWWLFMFSGLAVTADDFFCPSLAVISQTMKLSHNVAGVTFLAFGNGAPDVFSAIAAIGNAKAGDAGLAIGALFGGGVFVTAVIAGSIAIIKPFYSMQRPFLRDLIFYIAATFWAWVIMWDKKITSYEAAGLIVLYVAYVLVVVIGRYINQKIRGASRPGVKKLADVAEEEDSSKEDSNEFDPHQTPLLWDNPSVSYDTLRIPTPGASSSRSTPRNLAIEAGSHLQEPRRVRTDDTNEEVDDIEIEMSNINLLNRRRDSGGNMFKLILADVNPINTEEWSDMRFYGKAYEIFKSPLVLMLKLTVPVVGDANDENPLRNWNRPLNSLQLFTGPTFAILATGIGLRMIGGVFPVYGLVMIISAILAAVVFFTSKTLERPAYHSAYAYVGFVVAVVWIYCIANEIVNILQALGAVFDLSDAILGLTFLAWGNSIGDFIADMSMARQGYPRMGISACFGGPLFNLLIGLGLPFSIACAERGGTFELKVNLEEMVLALGLMLSLLSSIIIVPLSGFKMSRPYGIFLICLYFAFLLVAILVEVDVIKNKEL